MKRQSPLSRRKPSNQHARHSGGDSRIDGFHEIQDHADDDLIADCSVQHGVINGAVRPFDSEIFLDEIRAFPVHRIDKLLGFILALSASYHAPHLGFPRSIKKHAQSVWAVPEKMLRSSADDDRVPSFGHILYYTFCHLHDAFAVYQLEFMSVEASFVTAAQKRFEQPVVERISSFLSTLDDVLGALSDFRDFLGEQLIPQLPAQSVGKQLS